jgi:hypothetical protein
LLRANPFLFEFLLFIYMLFLWPQPILGN